MPSLERLQQELADEPFEVVLVNIKEEAEDVKKFFWDHNLSLMSLLDTDGLVSEQFGVRSTPAKFLIDPAGQVIAMALGYRSWTPEEMIPLLKALMER